MKKVLLPLLILITTGLFFYFAKQGNEPSQAPISLEATPNGESTTLATNPAKRLQARREVRSLTGAQETKGASGQILHDDEILPITSEQEFEELLQTSSVNSYRSLTDASDRLKASNLSFIAEEFLKELKKNPAPLSHERYRIILFANALNAKELLPFWQEVMATHSSLQATAPLTGDHNTIDEVGFRDLVLSIKNIGNIASFNNPEALQYLSNYVKDAPSSHFGETIRLEAFNAVHRADPFVALQLEKSLQPSDPLGKTINNMREIDRKSARENQVMSN